MAKQFDLIQHIKDFFNLKKSISVEAEYLCRCVFTVIGIILCYPLIYAIESHRRSLLFLLIVVEAFFIMLSIFLKIKRQKRISESKEKKENKKNEEKNKITLVNKNKLLKECPFGFSWKLLFFGFFVPLTRGDLKWTAILFLLACLVGGLCNWLLEIGPYGVIVWVICWFVFNCICAAKYNKLFIRDCLEKGYKPYDEKAKKALKEMGIYYAK